MRDEGNMKRGMSPWTPEIPGAQSQSTPEKRDRPHRDRSRPILVGGLTVVVAVVAVVAATVVYGLNHHEVDTGRPIAVAPTTTTHTPDRTGPTPTTTTTTTQPLTTPPQTSYPRGEVPDGYTAVTGPGGIQVSIPSGWTVTTPFASENEADDPSGSGSLIRYGGTPQASSSLLESVTADVNGNTSVKTGYQQLQLDAVRSASGDDTVVWEFLFDKNGVQRHVLSWFWRAHGTDYLVYFSATEVNWDSMRQAVAIGEQTAGPV
jgi:hypothetical protein